jgi:hypothetical protein
MATTQCAEVYGVALGASIAVRISALGHLLQTHSSPVPINFRLPPETGHIAMRVHSLNLIHSTSASYGKRKGIAVSSLGVLHEQ